MLSSLIEFDQICIDLLQSYYMLLLNFSWGSFENKWQIAKATRQNGGCSMNTKEKPKNIYHLYVLLFHPELPSSRAETRRLHSAPLGRKICERRVAGRHGVVEVAEAKACILCYSVWEKYFIFLFNHICSSAFREPRQQKKRNRWFIECKWSFGLQGCWGQREGWELNLTGIII